ncbi:MAG TPA: DUF72 domain-containing protein [Devosia sp.]|nr:DUF72 domain-containing protein [Devosia sp.]
MHGRADIRIGVSGWTYTPWRGNFYPPGLKQKDELSFAARQFNALEINGTFYGMQVPGSFRSWAATAPDGFVYAVKGPRYLTHMLKLTKPEAPLANFFASGVLALGPKLGPVLWQFPAAFTFRPEKLEPFFRLLPRSMAAAAELAARHDHRLRAPAHLDVTSEQPIRHAIEIRHESFRDPAFIALLRQHDVALVCADTVDWPLLMDVTSDFVYCRLHGNQELYNSRYSEDELDGWAERVRRWSSGEAQGDGNFVVPPLDDGRKRDCFVFFDNTDKLQAPDNARGLMRRLGVEPLGIAPATPSASIAA